MIKTIKTLVHTVFSNQQNWKLELLKHWPTILGNLKTKVYLEKIGEDTLVLSVADSCWLQEIYMLSPLLLETINKKLDAPRIKHLRFKKVGIKKKQLQKKAPVTKPNARTIRPLTLKEEQALQKVKDPVLRTALSDFLHRCRQESE